MSLAFVSILGKFPLRSFRSVGVLPWSQITARQSTRSASHGIIIGAAVDRLGQGIQLEMISRDDAEESGTRSARRPEIFRMTVIGGTIIVIRSFS